MRRVVITGASILSPIGNTLEKVGAALTGGKSGIHVMPQWQDIIGLRALVAGTVDNIDPQAIPRSYRRTMGRMAILGALAAREAVTTAALDDSALTSLRTGVAMGSTTGSPQAMEDFYRNFISTGGFLGLEGTLFPKIMNHTVAANAAAWLGVRGRLLGISSACASSTQAIGAGFETIRSGQQDVMICGGAEELHPSTIAVFDVLSAASRQFNDTPTQTPRPFDSRRDGLVLSEGAGAIVLEEHDHAQKRGAKILGEVLGYGTCCNAHHMTQPDSASMLDCMRLALDCAGLTPADLHYVNAHATGTLLGDAAEAESLRQLLSTTVPISGTKGYTGHTLAASGVMEVIFCLLMMRNRFIAPTLNLDRVGDDCRGLDHVQQLRSVRIDRALTSNFAFGGVSAALVLGKV